MFTGFPLKNIIKHSLNVDISSYYIIINKKTLVKLERRNECLEIRIELELQP